MANIATSRTRRLYQRPPSFPFALNTDSPLTRGLVAWWPLQGNSPQDGYYSHYQNNWRLTALGGLTVDAGPDAGLAPKLVRASSQALQVLSLPVAALPVSMGLWFNSTDLTVDQTLMAITRSGSTTGQIHMRASGTVANDPVQAMAGADAGACSSAAGFQANTWHHALGVWNAANDRSVYLDGGNKGTSTTNVASPLNGVDRIHIGRDVFGATFSGRVSDACVWQVALTDSEAQRLYDPATRWELYYPVGRRTYFFRPAGAASEIAGTLDAAEASDAVSAAGTVLVSGSLTVTEAGDTVTADGTVGSAATLTVTEASDSASAAGTVLASGTLTSTGAGDSIVSDGTLLVQGATDATEAGDSATADGTVLVTATLTVTEAGDTLSASDSSEVISGSLSKAEAGDVVTADGVVNPLYTPPSWREAPFRRSRRNNRH